MKDYQIWFRSKRGESQGSMVRRYAKLNLAPVGRESVGHGVVTRTYKPSRVAEWGGEEKCRRVLSSSPAWAMQGARSQSELHCKILSKISVARPAKKRKKNRKKW